MDLTGKGVFLTGGARGIGRAMMEVLLSKGAKVLFCDVRTETGKTTEAELQQKFGADNVIFRQCDVTDAEALKAVFEAAVSKFGSVDICVNNAAIIDERIWEKMIQINVVGQIRGSLLALDHMRRDRGGRGGLIINTVSDAGLQPVIWVPAYAATKHAVIGFTTSWAANPRMAEMGIKWRCFCPMATSTDFIPTEEGPVYEYESYRDVCLSNIMDVSGVAGAFLKMLEDHDNNDVIFQVRQNNASTYVRRQLVDSDGVSNLRVVDRPQTSAASQ